MKMIKAIVRPEKSEDVLDALLAGGFAAATKMSVLGRGKQKGLKVGDTYYDEIPKELIMLVVEDGDVDKVLKVIVENARVDKNGTYGDGKFCSAMWSVQSRSAVEKTSYRTEVPR